MKKIELFNYLYTTTPADQEVVGINYSDTGDCQFTLRAKDPQAGEKTYKHYSISEDGSKLTLLDEADKDNRHWAFDNMSTLAYQYWLNAKQWLSQV